jgi:hypothetical protein
MVGGGLVGFFWLALAKGFGVTWSVQDLVGLVGVGLLALHMALMTLVMFSALGEGLCFGVKWFARSFRAEKGEKREA